MPAPKGNRFAAKPDTEELSQSLFIRMTEEEKSICTEAAQNVGLSAWARKVLLGAATGEQGAADQRPTPRGSKA